MIRFTAWQAKIAQEFAERYGTGVDAYSPSHTWYGTPLPLDTEEKFRRHCEAVAAEIKEVTNVPPKTL